MVIKDLLIYLLKLPLHASVIVFTCSDVDKVFSRYECIVLL